MIFGAEAVADVLMPAPRLASLPLLALLAASCGTSPRGAPDAGDAGDAGTETGTDAAPWGSSQAPPLDLSPAPAPPAPGSAAVAAPAPALRGLTCPRGMLAIEGRFCIDKWEASLIDRRTGLGLSPYYPPERAAAAQVAAAWEKQRLEIGSDEARQIPIPALPDWQRQREVEPVAVSRAGMVPNGYLSGLVAERACHNARKRLCRHEEWTLACQGEQRRPFPYGAEYRPGACNIFRALHPALELHGNASVGHLDPRLNLVKEPSGDPLLRRTGGTPACRSAWGDDAAYDMNGNLDEWVEDDHGRFDGGFFSRSKRDGCASSVTAHPRTYYDYSTGARCCWSPGD